MTVSYSRLKSQYRKGRLYIGTAIPHSGDALYIVWYNNVYVNVDEVL